MKIYIEDNARMKMRKTAKYIHKHFGSKARLKFRNSIDNIIVLLRQNPKLGAQEQLLCNRSEVYRSIVLNKLNKIVYRISDDNIFIVDLWDIRREPAAQATQTRQRDNGIKSHKDR